MNLWPGLAVMVFVHGESWSWGSANLYDARVLATLGKVVVVTFNYRLGILGNSQYRLDIPLEQTRDWVE
jgi:carboxylesterase type B